MLRASPRRIASTAKLFRCTSTLFASPQAHSKSNGGAREAFLARRATTTVAEAMSTTTSASDPFRVAVVGGGLAGAAAANALAGSRNAVVRVTLFDAGFRGVGGRASSRPLEAKPSTSSEKTRSVPTDHGCQLIVDDGRDGRLTRLLREHASEWKREEGGRTRFVGLDAETGEVLPRAESDDETRNDFFGVLSPNSTVWVGSPTMDSVPKSLVGGSPAGAVDVRVGWKVTAVSSSSSSSPSPTWKVSARPPAKRGADGAFEQAELVDAGDFDAVVLADASVARSGSASAVSFPGGNDASSPALAALATSKRAPLFSVAALLPAPLPRTLIPFDVAVVSGGKSDVSVVVRESSKPGRRGGDGGGETWVAVSSRDAASELLSLAPPSNGPPPPEALEKAAERLWASASTALRRAAEREGGGGELSLMPAALRAQRWGAGVETSPSPSLFALDEGAMLASCGDAFGRGDAASALRSGVAVAEALLRARERATTAAARPSL